LSDIMLQTLWVNPEQAGVNLNRQVVPWAKPLLMAGHKIIAEFRLAEDAKTDAQRRKYHGHILTQIAEQACVNGQKFPMLVWKEHFRAEYLGFKTVSTMNPLTGKKSRRRVRISTEDLGVKAYAKLIEQVTAFAVTDLGVVFDRFIDPITGEIH
jgi:hypothetical protein